MQVNRTINILNAAVVDAEADAEAVYTLTSGDLHAINTCMASGGRVFLRILCGTPTSSPSFTIDSLSGTIDGTNYRTIQSFAPISITAAGEKDGPEITAPLHGYTALKLLITVTTLNGSNYLTVTAGLRVIA